MTDRNRTVTDADTLARQPRRERQTPYSLLLHVALAGAAFIMIAPLLWVACAAVKRPDDVFDHAFLPWSHLENLTLDNFRTLFARKPFGRWLINSLFLSSVQTVSVVTFSSLGGFALAKYSFRGRRLLMLVMLATMLLPGVVLLPSNYLLMYHLGWLNHYAAILLPGAVSAFGMFLFMQASKQIPDELLHAGRVDGCSELRLWWDIALPVIRPMIGAFTLLTFLGSWNSYLWPAIILQEENYTLPVGMATLLGLPEFDTNYGVVMAGTFLAILPVMALFFALQKEFIAGLATGAVKG